MIRHSELPAISELLSRLDIPPGRRGRTRCPIHRGNNEQAFSYSNERGLWHCFRCGVGGDALDLVKRSLNVDFKGALLWLGIEPRRPLQDPEAVKRQEQQRQEWACLLRHQPELRERFRIRGLIAFYGGEYRRDGNPLGWRLLHEAYRDRPLAAIEHELDELLETIPREAYSRPEDLPGYELGKLIAEMRKKGA